MSKENNVLIITPENTHVPVATSDAALAKLIYSVEEFRRAKHDSHITLGVGKKGAKNRFEIDMQDAFPLAEDYDRVMKKLSGTYITRVKIIR